MSLILDALNRADQQRCEENASPNPLHHHPPVLPTTRPIGRWIVEGATLLLIVGGIVYSQWPPGKNESQPVASTPAVISNNTVLTTAIEQTESVIKPQTPDLAISSLYQTAQPDNNKLAVIKQPTREPAADKSMSILLEIPLITDRSSRFQRTVPNIDYQVHVYSDKENAGFVSLNGSIHKIGSQIMPDMRVIAILKDSVVLDYHGTQFRLPAMNSWVNYN